MFSLFLYNLKETDMIYSYLLNNKSNDFTFDKKNDSIIFSFSSTSTFSDFLADLIIDLFEENLIREILEKHYCYFSYEEQLSILKESLNIVNDNSNSKHDLVYFSIYDYLSSESSMILSGFIRFRLKDYIEVLEYLINLSVNSFIVNREYDRFIDLLKDYIASSDSNADIVHLVYLKKESVLLDEHKNTIPFDDNILDAKYLSDISFSSNDFCLNTLLNLLPKKILIHSLEESDVFLETLTKIFGDRILFCNSCDICDFYKIHSSSLNVEN